MEVEPHTVLTFQSTPSGGKATRLHRRVELVERVSIHAFRGVGDLLPQIASPPVACFNPRLPGGRRPLSLEEYVRRRDVSIHAFRGEGDPHKAVAGHCDSVFQSTPSGGKATRASAWRQPQPLRFQSTPSGGKATPDRQHQLVRRGGFNPRLPGGRRRIAGCGLTQPAGFNPRLPGGRRRTVPEDRRRDRGVSIHAFRGEGDRNI